MCNTCVTKTCPSDFLKDDLVTKLLRETCKGGLFLQHNYKVTLKFALFQFDSLLYVIDTNYCLFYNAGPNRCRTLHLNMSCSGVTSCEITHYDGTLNPSELDLL